MKIFFLSTILLNLLNILNNTNAYPDRMKCGKFDMMTPGTDLDDMGSISSAYSSNQILIDGKALSGNTGTYTPDSIITVSLSPYLGQVVFQADGGAVFQGSNGKSSHSGEENEDDEEDGDEQRKLSSDDDGENVDGIIDGCKTRYQMYTDNHASLVMPTSGTVTIQCNYAVEAGQGKVFATYPVILTLAVESTSSPSSTPTTLNPSTLSPSASTSKTLNSTILSPTFNPTESIILETSILTVTQDIANVDIVPLKSSEGQNIFTQTVVNTLASIGVTSEDIKITDISSKSNRKYFHSQELESATVTYTITANKSLAPSIALLLQTSISNGSFEKYFKDQAVNSNINGLSNVVVNTAPTVNIGASTDVPNDNSKDSSLAGGIAVGTNTLILLFEWIAGIFGAILLCFCLLALSYRKSKKSDDESDDVDNSSETCLDRLFAWMENECKLLFTKVSESNIFTDVRMDKIYPAFNFTKRFRTSPSEAEEAIKESKRLSCQTVRGSETILRRDSTKPILSDDDHNLESPGRSVSILFKSPSQRRTPKQTSLDSNP